MRIGKLRIRAALQELSRVEDTDNTGEVLEVWRTLDTLQIDVTPLLGREYIQARRINSEVTHSVEARFYSGIAAKMRLVYGQTVLNIVAPMPATDRRQMILLCAQVDA